MGVASSFFTMSQEGRHHPYILPVVGLLVINSGFRIIQLQRNILMTTGIIKQSRPAHKEDAIYPMHHPGGH